MEPWNFSWLRGFCHREAIQLEYDLGRIIPPPLTGDVRWERNSQVRTGIAVG